MTRKEAHDILTALHAASTELEVVLDMRDWPDELCEALDAARVAATKYAERDNLSLSFSGEASESFSNQIAGMNDYYRPHHAEGRRSVRRSDRRLRPERGGRRRHVVRRCVVHPS
jgi:hypothetical protein